MTRETSSRTLWWIAAVALLCFLPFVNRPLFVDDHAVFAQAQDLLQHPGVPYATENGRLGWTPGQSVGEDNPPVHFYFLAAVIKLFGPEVWKSHLALIPIHLLGLFCFFSLARRYVQYPFWATVLWLTSPHYWLTANSLLVDGLLGSLMIISIALWVKACEDSSPGWALASCLLLGLTPLVKYTGLLSWGVVLAWTLLEGRTKSKPRTGLLAIPLLMFTAWMGWSHHLFGQNHFFAVAQSRMVFPSPGRLWTLASFTSATTPCILLSLILLAVRPSKQLSIIAFGLLLCCLGTGALTYRSWSIGLQVGFWVWSFLIWMALLPEVKQPPSSRWLFLVIWAGAGLLGLSCALDWVCARFLVIVGPALVLLTVYSLEQRAPELLRSARFRWGAFLLLAGFSALLAGADEAQARVDQKAAREVETWWGIVNPAFQKAYYPAAALGGLSYYLPSPHWTPAGPGQARAPGDALLVPWRTLPPTFLPDFENPQPLAGFKYESWIPLRTLDSRSGAGFYGSIWGPLPFSFSTAPLEVYTLVLCGQPA